MAGGSVPGFRKRCEQEPGNNIFTLEKKVTVWANKWGKEETRSASVGNKIRTRRQNPDLGGNKRQQQPR